MGLSWVSHSTLIYTSELILCSTISIQMVEVKKQKFRREWSNDFGIGRVLGVGHFGISEGKGEE